MNSPSVVLVTLSLVCCGRGEAADAPVRASAAIQECLAEYDRHAAERPERWTSVDRAYARVYDGEVSVLFTHGEAGTFGSRSPEYYSVIACHVVDAELHQVIYLAGTGAPIVGKDSDLSTIYSRTTPAESDGRAVELVFLRTDEKFDFSQAQPYSDKNLFRHNPNLK